VSPPNLRLPHALWSGGYRAFVPSTGLRLALAHLAGDYLLQTHHQATAKTSAWGPALAHAATYTAAHLAVTRSPWRLLVIGGTHAVIDRYRLAKHVVWAKNQLAPAAARPPHTATGYPDDVPPWMAVWLLIAADNTIHLLVNAAALAGADRD
jgi:hypothetical protein